MRIGWAKGISDEIFETIIDGRKEEENSEYSLVVSEMTEKYYTDKEKN